MTIPWWQSAVIYQVYPRSFQDTTGNGVGDLAGVTRRLDYLSGTLGVDAIWLSPFYPSPMADFGYDVADYCNVDPLFGSLEDFDLLVDEAHHRGLRIIVDWVPNHSSDLHPWFLESRSSRDNPKRDWYLWRDPKPDGSPPNNWLAAFGGPAWECDEATGQYYLHSFLPQQPDLNWRNPQVQAAMFDTVRFWLDRGVDGIRIDVAHHILKDPELRDNPPARHVGERPFKSLGEYDTQQHEHDKAHPDVHRVFRELRSLLDSYPGDRFALGEIHEFDWSKWASYYGTDLDELHMPYNFSLVWAAWNAERFRRLIGLVEGSVPPGGWPNYVLGNHDEPRLVSRYGEAAARVAAMLLLTLRGTPTLYYGDELGLPNVTVPREHQQDPWALRVEGVESRDGCRTPMPWDATEHAGFSPAGAASTWLPIPLEHQIRNVAAQLDDPHSMLSLYRRLLDCRRGEAALQVGSYQEIASPPGSLCFLRSLDQRVLLVALNFVGAHLDVRIGDLDEGEILLSTDLDRIGAADLQALSLRPHEGLVIGIE